MKKCIKVIHILFLFFNMQILISNSCDYHKAEQVADQKTADNETNELDKDDEKLLQEMLNILSSSYKNIIDIAALYFCGLSVDQNKLYEQIFIHLGKDMFNVIKLFSWYVPAMLKNSKLTIKEKFKKSCYVVSATVVFWYVCIEIFPNKIKHNSLPSTRSLNLGSYDIVEDRSEILKPRNRPKMDS